MIIFGAKFRKLFVTLNFDEHEIEDFWDALSIYIRWKSAKV